MKRVGIFPGTFDPVHNGHIAFALASAKVAGLDKVVLIPEPKPRTKKYVTDIAHRLKMLELVADKYENISVFKPDHDQFSVARTLPFFIERFPRTQLYLLVGSDVIAHLPNWPDAKKLLENMQIITAQRGLHKITNPGLAKHIIHTNFNDISSSKIRKQIKKDYLSPEIYEYSNLNKLY